MTTPAFAIGAVALAAPLAALLVFVCAVVRVLRQPNNAVDIDVSAPPQRSLSGLTREQLHEVMRAQDDWLLRYESISPDDRENLEMGSAYREKVAYAILLNDELNQRAQPRTGAGRRSGAPQPPHPRRPGRLP